MKTIGERWLFYFNNSCIEVDNAFTLFGWAQERVMVNGILSKEAGGWFVTKRIFQEYWLPGSNEVTLHVKLTSTLHGVKCAVYLGERKLDLRARYRAVWQGGRGVWPHESIWKSVSKV